jgi:signal transduction histidine kinase
MIEAIEPSSQRAALILRNMLAFSRKSDAVLASHDLANLLDQTLELVKNDFQIKKQHAVRQIKIVRRYSPDMPSISCDAGQIQQAIFNILKDGAQAMGADKDQSTAAQFTLTMDRQGDWGCMTITGNGPGMADDVRKRVFKPFYTTQPTGSGTGTGLSIAYFIFTESHGGMLFVASTPGRGPHSRLHCPASRHRRPSRPCTGCLQGNSRAARRRQIWRIYPERKCFYEMQQPA